MNEIRTETKTAGELSGADLGRTFRFPNGKTDFEIDSIEHDGVVQIRVILNRNGDEATFAVPFSLPVTLGEEVLR